MIRKNSDTDTDQDRWVKNFNFNEMKTVMVDIDLGEEISEKMGSQNHIKTN